MKNSKVLFLLMLVLFVPMVMTSCSDDDKDSSLFDELIGTWEYQAPESLVNIPETYTFTKDSRYIFAMGGSSYEEGSFTIDDNGVIELDPDLDYLLGARLRMYSGYIMDEELGHKFYKIR
ncbi:MAG: hypothetical protein ACI30C_02805 [Muribaculaceae bacterium]